MKLLIVDDNPLNLKLLRAQLEAEGLAVEQAAHGAEALRVLAAGGSYDGVISDILMPEMDGFRLCLELRKDPRLAQLPFLLYTSTYNSPSDRELARSVGADAYLTKPAPVQVILEALRQAPLQRPERAQQQVAPAPDEGQVLRQYNQALVNKLEEKNHELAMANGLLEYQLNLTRNITDTAAVGIFVCDESGRVSFMNAYAEKMFGWRFHELEGGLLAGKVQRDGEASQHHDDIFYRKDGRPVPVAWSRAPISVEGRPTGSVLTVHDLSDVKRAEAALRASERFARETLDSLSSHVAILDEQGLIIGTNKAWRAFEAPAGGGEGINYLEHCDRAAAGGDVAARRCAQGVRSVLAGEADELRFECAFEGAAGRRWFIVWLTRFRGEGDLRIVVARDDVTERKQAEDEVVALNAGLEQRVRQRTLELEAANRDLESANRGLEAFSYSVSHDLRAPLRVVDGYASLLLQDYAADLPPEAQRFLGLVRHGAQRMATLIEDLLRFAQTAQQPLDMHPVDLATVVAHCLAELREEIAARRIAVSVQPLPRLLADEAMLRQVFANLLGNAVKYTRRQEHPVIEVGCRQGEEDGVCIVHVKDNGAGFDMGHADKLFNVFQRLHRQDEFEGTGVGLAIVQRIVQRHGGRIWAEAAPGRGASFFLALQGAAP